MLTTNLVSKISQMETEDGIIFSPITIETYNAYSKPVILSVVHNQKTYTVNEKTSIRYRDEKYTLNKKGVIKTITLDEKFETFVISVKETEKIFYDVIGETEIVAIVDNKLVRDKDKLYGIPRRDKTKYEVFTVDCETVHSYYRFFDTTKDKNDFFVFWTEGEAKQYIIDNAICITYSDVMQEFEELMSNTNLSDEMVSNLKDNFMKKMIEYPIKKCDQIKKV